MNIDAIANGIVIDHITAGQGMRLYELLGLEKLDCSVAIIKNAYSAKMGKKDIIKIDADIPLDFDVIGYVDPGVSVNLIRGGELVEKRSIEMPLELRNVIFCRNVMIYFDQPTKTALINRMYDATVPGGYLIISLSENLPPDTKWKRCTSAIFAASF